ncbi:hypothetical protein [Candidatus Palauibacter sp.]|uniref:hypothetical protein n=1 Tax=Candidatus Palauibacter sp. TaxID=3101350 RepID=UPI003B022C51
MLELIACRLASNRSLTRPRRGPPFGPEHTPSPVAIRTCFAAVLAAVLFPSVLAAQQLVLFVTEEEGSTGSRLEVEAHTKLRVPEDHLVTTLYADPQMWRDADCAYRNGSPIFGSVDKPNQTQQLIPGFTCPFGGADWPLDQTVRVEAYVCEDLGWLKTCLRERRMNCSVAPESLTGYGPAELAAAKLQVYGCEFPVEHHDRSR